MTLWQFGKRGHSPGRIPKILKNTFPPSRALSTRFDHRDATRNNRPAIITPVTLIRYHVAAAEFFPQRRNVARVIPRYRAVSGFPIPEETSNAASRSRIHLDRFLIGVADRYCFTSSLNDRDGLRRVSRGIIQLSSLAVRDAIIFFYNSPRDAFFIIHKASGSLSAQPVPLNKFLWSGKKIHQMKTLFRFKKENRSAF